MSPGIILFPKYLYQQVVYVPNNKDGHYRLCNFLSIPFICYFIFFFKDRIVSQYQGGGLVTLVGQQTSSKTIFCSLLLGGNIYIMDLQFKWVR